MSTDFHRTPAEQPNREPLAVVGIGCRLPGGINSPTAFWDALLSGVDAIRAVPSDRWNHARFHDTNPEKAGCIRNAKGGFIDGVDQFDADFFGYFPAEAQRLDPQQRLLLEVTHEAMEDAGMRRDQLDGSATSVYVGSFMYDYLCMQTASEQRDEINPYVAMGTSVSSLANRISFDYNLKGPSISLDTACSSSLVAVHLACRSLWGKEAAMAIAGGVNVMLRPEASILLSKAGFLTTDQYCKAFDAAANGYVRSEGAGVVIIKPLSRATADGDAIYAVIRGTAVNQDGYLPEGFTVPNVIAQVALLETAYAEAGVDPLSVHFVEAHGTGTPVGDPIECLALGAVLGRDRAPGQKCLLGSVKTNLGHLEGASGIAGFIKGVLTAFHGIAPPNLHFHQPNPAIDFDDLKLAVPTRPTPLKRDGSPFIVGVNSFGAGGTNAHIVLQEVAPQYSSLSTRDSALSKVYVLSAAHPDALRALALRHAEWLDTTDFSLDDLAFSAFTRRSHYPHVLAVVGNTPRTVADQLRAFAEGRVDRAILATKAVRKMRPKVGFVFSGQGGQWIGMGRQLMEREHVFRDAMVEIDRLFTAIAGWSLLDEIRKEAGDSRIDDTIVVQPTVMAIQIGLVKLYEHYGVRPQGVVGHSIGEVAAAFAAGALSLADAVQVIYHRSQAQNRASGKGGMLAVGLSLEEARKVIHGHESQVSIGAVNGPEMLTLSGDTEPLQQIAKLLDARGVFNRPVRVQVAYHSHHMDSIRDAMMEGLNGIKARAATTPLYSTVTGRREAGPHLTADYWHRNARQPVLFTDALTNMLKDGLDTFIEIGPHPVLVAGAEALFQKLVSGAVIGPAMTRREPESVVFLHSLARLAARGVELNIGVLFGPNRRFVRLPKYAWQHTRCWYEAPALAELRHGRFENPFLKRQTPLVTEDGLAVWEASIGIHKFPYLHDHQVDGECVLPATAHIELAWAAAREQVAQGAFFLENLHFDSPLILADNSNKSPLEIRLEIVSGEGDYRICSRAADAARDVPWSKHSSGRINTTHDRFEKSTVALVDLQRQFAEEHTLSVDQFYQMRRAVGLDYGEKFRGIQQLWRHHHQLLARLQIPVALVDESKRYAFHPAFLDACLHVVFADVHCHGDPERAFLPYRVARIRFHGRPSETVWSHIRVTRNDEQYLTSDMLIFDDAGELIAEVLGLTCKRLLGAGSRQEDASYEGCYEYRWKASARPAGARDRVLDFTRAMLITGARLPSGQTGGEGLANELATRLAGEGVQPLIIRSDELSEQRDGHRRPTCLDDLLADLPLDRRTLIVFAAGIDAGANRSWTGLKDCPAIALLLQLAQTIHKREGVPRLFVVTDGAAGVAGDERLDLGQATLHGMARVINNECVSVPVTTVDLSDAGSSSEIDALMNELLHIRVDRDESEIALRGGDRFVRQLVPIDRDAAEQVAASNEPGMGGAYRADLADPGALDQIVFRRLPPAEVSEGEVEIAVEAAALNFKDIMNAMGLLPEHAVSGGLSSDHLGLEVAGRVLRVGAKVQHLHVDDEVIARVADGFSGRVVTPAHYVVRRPDCLTPTQAAGVPVVYVTAWYSLHHLGRMAPGETVLIHSAAGGVGGAAIQLAHRAGATVIATAGTKEKRAYLRQQGVRHVFDSRSLECFNQVMEVTGNRGVDIVLNSLTGRFIAQSLKCLAPFGRFIEIGKADIYRNSKLGLERFGENISYFVVDVDRLAAHKPPLHQQVMEEVVALFGRGELHPLEVTEFPITKLPEAMKFMTRAAYRGKIVMKMQDERVPTLPPRRAAFRHDRSYLISGGASGFGLEIARWMVERGARHVVLLSRSGPKSDADRQAVEALREEGAEVLLMQADIVDRDALTSLMQRLKNELPPLAGVVHGAAVLEDASLANMDMGRFERVFNPKAQGAWNLHEATMAAGANLDFFVMLSSISSVLGLHGQLNYAAANFFQDALAQYRRQRGLPATSINLGVLGQYAGMSKNSKDAQDVIGILESHGMLVMPLADVLSKVEAALVQQPVQRMTARFDWARFRTAYPHLVNDSRFAELLSDAALARSSRSGGARLREALAELPLDQRRDRLQQELTAALARILDVKPEQLDGAAPIDNLGLDSLMLTQMRNWILRSLDINFPLIKLLKGPSMTTLSAELVGMLDSNSADGAATKEEAQAVATFMLGDLEGVRVLSPWLIRGRGRADAPCRLICFHSMAVGASLFTNFLLHPPAGCDILAVQTPGRENRKAEPVVETLAELADQIVPQLLPLLDRPLIIWGHSHGGIVAVEVIRRLRERHQCEPIHFMVTGTIAPHLIHLWQNREVILRSVVEDINPEYMIAMSRFVDDPEFLKAIMPGFRRDFPLLKNYHFQPMPPLNCPITAFAARQDDVVYLDELAAWSRHTSGGFELIEVDGDHWFLNRNREQITATLQEITGRVNEMQPALYPRH